MMRIVASVSLKVVPPGESVEKDVTFELRASERADIPRAAAAFLQKYGVFGDGNVQQLSGAVTEQLQQAMLW